MKRPVLYGAVWWMAVFVEGCIMGALPAIANMSETGLVFTPVGWGFHLVALFLMATLLSNKYFERANPSRRESSRACMIVVGVGVVLDAVLTVPLFVKSYGFFLNPTAWTGVGVFAVVFLARARHMRKHE